MSRRCRGCGRPLRLPSLDGYGPVCRSRIVPAAPSPARATAARHTGTHAPAQPTLEDTMTDTTTAELERIGHELLLRRVRAAEGVAFQALNLPPQKDETAHQFAARIRDYAERTHPELIVRFEHSRQEVLPLAETCGCDPDEDYDDDHIESDDPGEYLCTRRHLGFVCGTCVQPEGEEDGPEWAPTRFEWPCPPVAALDLS